MPRYDSLVGMALVRMAPTRGAALVLLAVGCGRDPAPTTRVEPPAAVTDASVEPIAIAACGPTSPVVADPAGRTLLAALGGTLDVALSEPPIRIGSPELRAEHATPTATITAVAFAPHRLVDGERVPLTAAELDQVIFRGTVLRLRSFGQLVEHTSDDCAFTLRDLIGAIELTERRARAHNAWTDRVDIHHVHLQSVTPGRDGAWRLTWAS